MYSSPMQVKHYKYYPRLLWTVVCIIALIMLCPFSTWAQKPEEVPLEEVQAPTTFSVEEDTTIVTYEEDEDWDYEEEEYIPVDLKDSIAAMQRMQDFAYMATLDSMLRSMEMPMEAPKPPKKTSNYEWIGDVLRVLLWAAALLGVSFLVLKLLGGSSGLFVKNKSLAVPEQRQEAAAQVQYSAIQLAQQAAARGDYRLAVRYQHQYLLEQLAAKKLVLWLPQKTNAQYISEIKNAETRKDFSRITLQYEYVWFGQFPISAEQYAWIEEGCKTFLKQWC